MAANTGPDLNTYSIPEVALGDTFNTWRDITNTNIYKLNKIKTYDGFSSSSIDLNVSSGGTFSPEIATNVNKGITFMLPVNFQSGVTFNGAVTFNASTFTVNANVVTIDDYNIVLGDTTGASDTEINTAGGGGLLLKRTGNTYAEWLWRADSVHGVTGVWRSNAHIGFSGTTSGLYPTNGGVLPVYGSGIRIGGGNTSDHGLLVSLSNDGGTAGTTANRSISFSRYAPTGSTAFMTVLSGATYGAYPNVSIPSGANKKTIRQNSHGFSFGSPVRIGSGGAYELALGDSAENAEIVGVVSDLLSENEFEISFIGEIFGDFRNVTNDGTSLTPGGVYYIHPTLTGKYNSTPSTISGSVHKACFVATGVSSAIVLPFTGGVISDPVLLSDSSSLTTPIRQYNTFKIGDVVRFRAGNTTLSYGYTLPSAGTISETYTNGIYVLAQANNKEDAEVAGVVTKTDNYTVNGTNTGINMKFNVLMDGFFDLGSSSGGISAANGSVPGKLTAGTVYYLNSNTVGTTGSLENASKYCLTSVEPTTIGHVRKPVLLATANYSGYAFSYRGDVYAGEALTASGYSHRNRVINGDMRVNQRGNQGATYGPSVGARYYAFDMWWASRHSSGTTFTYQGGVTSGATLSGHMQYLRIQTSALTPGITASSHAGVGQMVEYANMQDFMVGLPTAKISTVSFWVRSSMTGSHSFLVRYITTGAISRSCVSQFAISVANTWEYKSITIPADTVTDGPISATGMPGIVPTQFMIIQWNVGSGSDFWTPSTTVGQWITGIYEHINGGAYLGSVANATMDITGVQWELGSIATPFEYRPYSVELEMCQRYYQQGFARKVTRSYGTSTEFCDGIIPFTTYMRPGPTMAFTNVPYTGAQPGGLSGGTFEMVSGSPPPGLVTSHGVSCVVVGATIGASYSGGGVVSQNIWQASSEI